MGIISLPNSFTAGTKAVAPEVNSNFETLRDVINGQIDDANVKASANIALTKILHMATQHNTGDGTHKSGFSVGSESGTAGRTTIHNTGEDAWLAVNCYWTGSNFIGVDTSKTAFAIWFKTGTSPAVTLARKTPTLPASWTSWDSSVTIPTSEITTPTQHHCADITMDGTNPLLYSVSGNVVTPSATDNVYDFGSHAINMVHNNRTIDSITIHAQRGAGVHTGEVRARLYETTWSTATAVQVGGDMTINSGTGHRTATIGSIAKIVDSDAKCYHLEVAMKTDGSIATDILYEGFELGYKSNLLAS